MKPEPSDPQLSNGIGSVDQAALAQMLANHQRRLYHTVLCMVGDRDDAVQVAQQTVLKVVEQIGDNHGQDHVSTWMTRIAMNLSLTLLGKRQRKGTAGLNIPAATGERGGDQMSPLRDQLADSCQSRSDAGAKHAQTGDGLRVSLGHLEDDLRAVLVLRDIQAMGYAQIAAVLALPMGTVKNRLFRARLALRHELGKLSVQENVADSRDIPPPRLGQGDTLNARHRSSSATMRHEFKDG